MDRPEHYWVQDSSGVSSCHVNDGNLNFEQSLIGRLSQRENGWRAILKDGTDITPESSGTITLSQARMCLENYNKKLREPAKPVERSRVRVAQSGKI